MPVIKFAISVLSLLLTLKLILRFPFFSFDAAASKQDFFCTIDTGNNPVLYFLRKGVKLHFYSLGTIFEENIWGVQRGEAPWLWVSNRGESIPVGTRFSFGKSSVLYFVIRILLTRIALNYFSLNYSLGKVFGDY